MINESEVRRKYSEIKEIWSNDDRWHVHTRRKIDGYVREFLMYDTVLDGTDKILLVGSAGNSHGLKLENMIHLDISEKFLSPPNSIAATATNLPIASNSIKAIVCVGSVINYTDIYLSLSELSRVLIAKGKMLIEFESSWSFEYLFKKAFKKHACISETFYQNKKEMLWVYSDTLVVGLAKKFGLGVDYERHIHILSPLLFRFTGLQNLSSKVSFLDDAPIVKGLLSKYASNVIICFSKFSE